MDFYWNLTHLTYFETIDCPVAGVALPGNGSSGFHSKVDIKEEIEHINSVVLLK